MADGKEQSDTTLSRAVGPEPHRPRDFFLGAFVACVVAANGAFVANIILPMLELWWLDLGVYTTWPASSPFVGTYWMTAWLLGAFVPGLVVSWLLSWAVDRTWFRVLAACFGLGCLALIGVTLWFWPTNAQMSLSLEEFHQLTNPDDKVPFPLVHIMGLAAGFLAAMVVLFRKVRRINNTRRARLGLLALTACFTVALGLATFAETWTEYQPQRLPEFELEMVAAYPLQDQPPAPGTMPAFIVDANGEVGEIVEYDGHRYNIHRTDSLIIKSDEVQRVRWHHGDDGKPYVSVRPDRHVAARMRKRSIKRMSMHDALFVNGQLLSVPLYQDVITDRLWLHSPNVDEQRQLFDLLTVTRAGLN